MLYFYMILSALLVMQCKHADTSSSAGLWRDTNQQKKFEETQNNGYQASIFLRWEDGAEANRAKIRQLFDTELKKKQSICQVTSQTNPPSLNAEALKWVQQFSSTKYQVRQNASRELQGMLFSAANRDGSVHSALLSSLKSTDDREITSRIQSILNACHEETKFSSCDSSSFNGGFVQKAPQPHFNPNISQPTEGFSLVNPQPTKRISNYIDGTYKSISENNKQCRDYAKDLWEQIEVEVASFEPNLVAADTKAPIFLDKYFSRVLVDFHYPDLCCEQNKDFNQISFGASIDIKVYQSTFPEAKDIFEHYCQSKLKGHFEVVSTSVAHRFGSLKDTYTLLDQFNNVNPNEPSSWENVTAWVCTDKKIDLNDFYE